MTYREFVTLVHKSTKRDYLARVTERDKADVAELALKWDYDYWDGSRQTGYGGYRYDGRWRKVADAMVSAYGLKPGMRVLDDRTRDGERKALSPGGNRRKAVLSGSLLRFDHIDHDFAQSVSL